MAELRAFFKRFERCSQTASYHFYLLWESFGSQDPHKTALVVFALSNKTYQKFHSCHPRNGRSRNEQTRMERLVRKEGAYESHTRPAIQATEGGRSVKAKKDRQG